MFLFSVIYFQKKISIFFFIFFIILYFFSMSTYYLFFSIKPYFHIFKFTILFLIIFFLIKKNCYFWLLLLVFIFFFKYNIKYILIKKYRFDLYNFSFFYHISLLIFEFYFFFFFFYSKFFTKKNTKKNIKLFVSLIVPMAILFGSMWSSQEVMWNGYWSWDIIEVFSLLHFGIFYTFVHFFFKKNIKNKIVIYLLMFSYFFSFFLSKKSFSLSIHSFSVDAWSNVSFFYFFLIIFYSLYFFNIFSSKKIKQKFNIFILFLFYFLSHFICFNYFIFIFFFSFIYFFLKKPYHFFGLFLNLNLVYFLTFPYKSFSKNKINHLSLLLYFIFISFFLSFYKNKDFLGLLISSHWFDIYRDNGYFVFLKDGLYSAFFSNSFFKYNYVSLNKFIIFLTNYNIIFFLNSMGFSKIYFFYYYLLLHFFFINKKYFYCFKP